MALLSAKVFTGDPARPWAEAVGIDNGKIAAVGTNSEVKAALTGKVEAVDLPGRLVTPGLVDGHCHFLSYGLSLRRVDLRDLPSLAACRERIREAVRGRAPGVRPSSWIRRALLARAWCWVPSMFHTRDRRFPSRSISRSRDRSVGYSASPVALRPKRPLTSNSGGRLPEPRMGHFLLFKKTPSAGPARS